ncbi:hypothetical protein ACFY7C_19745 [Streptomyces sp. NPDC012769]|uniref:hypothetical protein n=1 Tax=Streptomyces sp. NPDC012769 TaxID=3364848 RepID=UPI0036A2F381
MTPHYQWNGVRPEPAPPVRATPPFTTPHVVDVNSLKVGDFYQIGGNFYPIKNMIAPTRTTKVLHFEGPGPQVVHGTVTVHRAIERIGPTRQALFAGRE